MSSELPFMHNGGEVEEHWLTAEEAREAPLPSVWHPIQRIGQLAILADKIGIHLTPKRSVLTRSQLIRQAAIAEKNRWIIDTLSHEDGSTSRYDMPAHMRQAIEARQVDDNLQAE